MAVMRTLNAIRYSIALVALVACTHSLLAETNNVDPYSYAILRKQFLDAFAKTEIGQDVSKLSLPRGWLQKASIQDIHDQTESLDVRLQAGTTVFRIYPYWRVMTEDNVRSTDDGTGKPSPSRVIVKVGKPSLTYEKMIEALEGHESGDPVRFVEYAVYYSDGKLVHISKKKS
jgi:hypothetical protein